MSTQASTAVAISGGAISGTPIGLTDPSSANFTSINLTSGFSSTGSIAASSATFTNGVAASSGQFTNGITASSAAFTNGVSASSADFVRVAVSSGLTAGTIAGTPIGATNPSSGDFTALKATSFASSNVNITGGSISGVGISGSLSSSNVAIDGGYISGTVIGATNASSASFTGVSLSSNLSAVHLGLTSGMNATTGTFTGGVTASSGAFTNGITASSATITNTLAANAVAATSAVSGQAVSASSALTGSSGGVTNAWTVGDQLNVGDQGTESTGIIINGVMYDSRVKISDIGDQHVAQTIFHRHSKNYEAAIFGARSNSSNNSHGNVTAGQKLMTIAGLGWTSTLGYQLAGMVSFRASTQGAISSASMPGAIDLYVTPTGSIVPVVAATIEQDKSVGFFGGISGTSGTFTNGMTASSGSFSAGVAVTSAISASSAAFTNGMTASSATFTNAVAVGYIANAAPVTKTADFTLAATENWVINNKASACVVTLPAASGFTGREVTFQNYQDFTLTSIASDVVPLGGGAAGTSILLAVAGSWATVVSNGTNWVIMRSTPNNILLLS